jgi:hypothetical protein
VITKAREQGSHSSRWAAVSEKLNINNLVVHILTINVLSVNRLSLIKCIDSSLVKETESDVYASS